MARKLGADFPLLIHAKCVEITTPRIPSAAIGNSGYSSPTTSRKCQNREDGAIYLEQNRLKSPFSHEVIFSLFTLPHKISSRSSETGKIMCNSLIFLKNIQDRNISRDDVTNVFNKMLLLIDMTKVSQYNFYPFLSARKQYMDVLLMSLLDPYFLPNEC